MISLRQSLSAAASSANRLLLLSRQRRSISTSLTKSKSSIGTLRVQGPDAAGIVAACTQLLGQSGNILKSESWTCPLHHQFFQRIVFSYPKESFPKHEKLKLEQELQHIASHFRLDAELNWRSQPPRVGILVSKYDHCLWELLKAQELDMEIPLIISNHNECRPIADQFDIPYHLLPITPDTKAEQEAKQLKLLAENKVDVVVLARYMQVLSENFLQQFPNRVINIHHSFLPAFMGGRPYHGAYERGVKLIGATAHYATLDLDDGPIIEQDITQVSHRDSIRDMMRKGRILERNVLLRALEAHLDDRVLVYKNKCVVFGD